MEPILLCGQRRLSPEDEAAGQLSMGIAGMGQRAVGEKLWQPGQTITIRFMDGDEDLRAFMTEYAQEWLEYANLKFLWLDGNYESMIRVSFAGSSSWSYIGTDCLMVQRDYPTMNIDTVRMRASMQGNERDARYLVLHEFGHMLGLQHEQHNPKAEIPWDLDEMYRFHEGELGWSRAEVERTYLLQWPITTPHTEYDPTSIMHYPIDRRFTTGKYFIDVNQELSELDKEFMRQAYPQTALPEIIPVIKDDENHSTN